MPDRRFDAVLIDFYGTISAGDREAVEAVCRHIVEVCALPVDPLAFAIAWGERFFEVIEQSNHDAFRTLYECELGSLCDMLNTYGVERDPVPLVAMLEAYWADPPVYDDAVEFLAQVDLPICCVSNADTKPLLTAIERHGLRFDAVVTSEEARCYKPDPAIFHRALDKIRVDPACAVHVGDSLHSDISGAGELGLGTVWLHRENRIHDIGRCRPDHTIRSLAELPNLLRQGPQ